MKKPDPSVVKFIESQSEDYMYHGTVKQISAALSISEDDVIESINLIGASNDAKVFWFAEGWVVVKLLPFSDYL